MVFEKRLFGVFLALILGVGLLFFHDNARASSTDGSIDSVYKYAWGENIGWINFGASNGNVRVTDAGLSGSALSETVGWINVDGVENDGQGNLSGSAWGENVGYIKFDPTNGGVTIGQNGEFSGSALGENIGWIVFSGDFSVKTDWRPRSARSSDDDEDDRDIDISKLKTETTSNSIIIRWRTNRKADSEIRWGIDRNLERKEDSDKNERTHEITLKGLLSDTVYYFRVRSEDENGVSDRTSIISVKTDSKPKLSIISRIPKEEDREPEEISISVSDAPREEGKQEQDTRIDESEPVSENVAVEDEDKPSLFRNIAISVASTFSSMSSSAQSIVLSVQKRIVFISGRMLGEFEKTYYTTNVFPKKGVKTIAEVKFQLLTPENIPIAHTPATLSSEPQTNTTDESGIVSFKDIEIGDHALAFSYEGNDFRKKIAISDTVTDDGIVRAEVIRVVAGFDRIALWMWSSIIILIGSTAFFAVKYYRLRRRVEKE